MLQVMEIDSLRPASGGAARFEGYRFGATTSFFVVTSAPGKGADKHRHPYDETFVILDGNIEVIVDGEMRMITGGHIAIIPAGAWHEFKNRSEHNALMVNIHPAPRMTQEDWPPESE